MKRDDIVLNALPAWEHHLYDLVRKPVGSWDAILHSNVVFSLILKISAPKMFSMTVTLVKEVPELF